MFALAGLTLRGTSNGYPVSLEYKNNTLHVIIGIEKTGRELEPFRNVLKREDLSVNDVGVVKKLSLKEDSSNSHSPFLGAIIDKTTSYLKENGLKPFSIGSR